MKRKHALWKQDPPLEMHFLSERGWNHARISMKLTQAFASAACFSSFTPSHLTTSSSALLCVDTISLRQLPPLSPSTIQERGWGELWERWPEAFLPCGSFIPVQRGKDWPEPLLMCSTISLLNTLPEGSCQALLYLADYIQIKDAWLCQLLLFNLDAHTVCLFI